MSEVIYTVSPLANSFQRCSHSFKQLYLALFAYGPISLSRFNDEYGRFGVWGGDSGADRTGRGSLDDVLRTDPKTASIIAEVLENLDEDLNICIALVKASTGPQVAQSHDGQEWLSDEESSISSGSDTDIYQVDIRSTNKTQRILHLLAIIVDHIQSLFQVSALLRRPTISDKYLRSTSKKKTAETISPFFHWDLAHIVEKRRFWINQQIQGSYAKKGDLEDIQYQTNNYLCSRLATANVRRREQLDFWQRHPAEPSAIKLPDEPIQPKSTVIPNVIPIRQPIEKAVPKSEISKPSHGTKQSFSTVAKSDLNDSATFSGRPRTEYVSSTKGGKYVLRVPPVPKISDESPTFKCPYCSTDLDTKSMLLRELWKKHVFRDLRPYVCTFQQCENSEKLYLTRHDWIYHETQMHRRQWICASCSHQRIPSRNDMKKHLEEKHAGQFLESQLMIMVDICERPMDDDEDAECPICLSTLSLSALRIHLATHLEELALFVLPCHMEDQSQDVGSDKAEGAAVQQLPIDVSSNDDELPHLDFEQNISDNPRSQDPAIFSTLLQNATEFRNNHMEDWFLTNDQTVPRGDGVDTEAIAPLLAKPDATTQTVGESAVLRSIFNDFLSTLSKARRLQRIVEQLTADIVDHPGPKSAVTLGNVLTTLESLNRNTLTKDVSFWEAVQQANNRLRTCIKSMLDIIETAKLCIRQPTSDPGGEVSIWEPDKNLEILVERLGENTNILHRMAVEIAEQDMEILQAFLGK